VTIRLLVPGDEGALDAFLALHADTSLFPRSNLRRGGIVDQGQVFQATYAAAFDADGTMVAMAGHCWNGNVQIQAPVRLDEVVRAAVAATGRDVKGLLGSWDQVQAAHAVIAPGPPSLSSPEILFSLELTDLRVPSALSDGSVACRRAVPGDLDLLTRWRMAYRVETGISPPGVDTEAPSRDDIRRVIDLGDGFVLEAAGQAVAYSAFNARLPDTVQIGGVWTPPDLRGRGYARAVVAGSLLAVLPEGVTRSVLFTDPENIAAQTAYGALGYRPVGMFGIVLY